MPLSDEVHEAINSMLFLSSTDGLQQPVQGQEKKAVAREERDKDVGRMAREDASEPKTLTGSCACLRVKERKKTGPSRTGLAQHRRPVQTGRQAWMGSGALGGDGAVKTTICRRAH